MLSFLPLPSAAFGLEGLSIAVPSRLYYIKTKEKPLAGVRIAIKDNFNLEGLPTTLVSRSYLQLYGREQHKTASLVQELIDLGAVIVGKTKLSQFAAQEQPSADCVDYPAPFNPRGDGYRSPQGSSSGSASALAAYDWLDLTLGNDGIMLAVPCVMLYRLLLFC